MSQAIARLGRPIAFTVLVLLVVATPASSGPPNYAFEAVSWQAAADVESVVSPTPDWSTFCQAPRVAMGLCRGTPASGLEAKEFRCGSASTAQHIAIKRLTHFTSILTH